MKFKIIKVKVFTANGSEHTHYTVAYQGRVFGISTLRFEGNESMISVNDQVLIIKGDIEVLKNTSVDPLTGATKTYLDIVPKSGLLLAEF